MVLGGELLELPQQRVIERQIVGDARLAPDDQVGVVPGERPVGAELVGQRQRRVDSLGRVVPDAGLDQRDRGLADGGERRGQGERERAGSGGGRERGDAERAEREPEGGGADGGWRRGRAGRGPGGRGR